MADHFIGLNRGAIGYADAKLVYGTSTAATDVELRVADAAGWTRAELYQALKVISDKLVAPGSPDADSQFPVI